MRPAPAENLSDVRAAGGKSLRDGYRQYNDAQRAVYYNYIAAYDHCRQQLNAASKHAKRYLGYEAADMGGYDQSLAAACESLRSLASSAASTFGYGGGLSWDITPLAKTNEIYVDFR